MFGVHPNNNNPLSHSIDAGKATPDPQQQGYPMINFKTLNTKNTNRMLSASELYELAKQIKYKHYQQIQQRRQNQISPSMTNGFEMKKSPRNGMDNGLNLHQVFNVIKLTEKRVMVPTFPNPINGRQHNSGVESRKPLDLSKVQYSHYKLDSNFIGGSSSPDSKMSRHKRDTLNFVMRYGNRNVEFCSPDPLPPREGSSSLDVNNTSRNPGHTATLQNNLSKHRLLQPLDEFQQQRHKSLLYSMEHLSTAAQQNILISQVQELTNLGDEDHVQSFPFPTTLANMLYNDIDYQYYMQQQPMAYGQPMKMINEQEEIIPQQIIPVVKQQRLLKKNLKQQLLQKITKISDLEKLLYTLPGLEESPLTNNNPGGGGRVANRPNQQLNAVIPKRKPEPQINDNENQEFQEHPVNKTIKMMSILNTLIFKVNFKEYNPVVYELLVRCGKFFQFSVPKQYRTDVPALLKQKDFLSQIKERMLATFMQTINKCNGITDQMLLQNQGQQFKYFIGSGNNHMLVRTVFKQRSWWTQNEKENFEECNFVWTQWIKERHIRALPKYEKQNEAACGNGQDPQELEASSSAPIKIYNKMHANYTLSDKKHLFFNMRDLYQSEGKDPFSVMPLTYVINDGLNDLEFDRFEEQFKSIEEELKQNQQSLNFPVDPINVVPNNDQMPKLTNIWIIKPGEDTNRGCGIIVSRDFQEIKNMVRDKSSKKNKTAILQKYIENPLLINRRKFDIRCYGLLTSINGNMQGYFYQDGYLRTSCKEFNVQNLSNRFIHLTNDAVQKNSEDYGKFENANKLSFSDFDKYFAEFPPPGVYEVRFQRDFLPQIRALVRDSFRSVEGKIDPDKRTNTFEIFGYDFMIDDQMKLKMIEVNTNPSIEVCCPLLARIIPSMLDSVFRIAVDPLFQQPPSRRVLNVNEIINDLKMELIFESGSKC